MFVAQCGSQAACFTGRVDHGRYKFEHHSAVFTSEPAAAAVAAASSQRPSHRSVRRRLPPDSLPTLSRLPSDSLPTPVRLSSYSAVMPLTPLMVCGLLAVTSVYTVNCGKWKRDAIVPIVLGRQLPLGNRLLTTPQLSNCRDNLFFYLYLAPALLIIVT